jgi:hypothetical protein
VTIERVVVFPAPFGPTNPKKDPAVTLRSMSSTAVRSPNDLERLATDSAISAETGLRRLVDAGRADFERAGRLAGADEAVEAAPRVGAPNVGESVGLPGAAVVGGAEAGAVAAGADAAGTVGFARGVRAVGVTPEAFFAVVADDEPAVDDAVFRAAGRR